MLRCMVVTDLLDIVEPLEVKRNLGVVPQEIALYQELTVRDNLCFWGLLYGLSGKELSSHVDEPLSLVGSERKGDAVTTILVIV